MAVQQENSLLYNRAKILLDRLERLSADSTWAHRASGLRGSIIRSLGETSTFEDELETAHLKELVELGYEILNRAASEIPE